MELVDAEQFATSIEFPTKSQFDAIRMVKYIDAIYTRPLPDEEQMRTNLAQLDRSVSVKKVDCCGEKHRIDYLASQKILAIYNHPVLTDDDHYVNKALAEMGDAAPTCFKLLAAFKNKTLFYDHGTRTFVIEVPWNMRGIAIGSGSVASGAGGNIMLTGGITTGNQIINTGGTAGVNLTFGQ